MNVSRNSIAPSVARASSTTSSIPSRDAFLPRASSSAGTENLHVVSSRPSSRVARGLSTPLVDGANARGAGGSSAAIGRKRKPSATASVGSAAKLLKRADGDKKQGAKHQGAKEGDTTITSNGDTMSVDTDAVDDVDAPDVKRPMSLDDIPSGLKCSLSGQLMAAPVVMNDGNKYDLEIIDNVIKETEINGKQLKSPVTGNRMNKASKNPCNDTLANIEQLINSDAVEKEIADDWRRRRNQVKFESGDMSAAVELGLGYMRGSGGHRKDPKKGFRWFKKAADKLDRQGLYWAAMCYICGEGVRENETVGIHLMTLAATHMKGGYGKAVYRLAEYNYKGSLDKLPKNLDLAEHFLVVLCQEKYDTNYGFIPDKWRQNVMKWMKSIRKNKAKK